MPEYQFEIQGYTKITVEADNSEAARMMLIEDESLYENKLMDDCYISDGEMMELKKLTLQDGEQIDIGADIELSVTITRHGDSLKIEGPVNCISTTAILTRSGLKLTRKYAKPLKTSQ
jgi:hypothetical protein